MSNILWRISTKVTLALGATKAKMRRVKLAAGFQLTFNKFLTELILSN